MFFFQSAETREKWCNFSDRRPLCKSRAVHIHFFAFDFEALPQRPAYTHGETGHLTSHTEHLFTSKIDHTMQMALLSILKGSRYLQVHASNGIRGVHASSERHEKVERPCIA